MKRICVFCGSGLGSDPLYANMAVQLGKTLVNNQIELVYGGGNVGLMGIIADTVVKNGGRVIGVITEYLLEKEVAYTALSDLRIVETMHQRKEMMASLSDGFIAMPGGFGTMDEMFEAMTWSQLNIHRKPCGFLNVKGYYDQLMAFIDHMVSNGFVHEDHKRLIQKDDDPERLIGKLVSYTHNISEKDKWAKKLAVSN
ncbi:MAG: TIGR00730 family Rossman fold protein [Desulfobacteraceae bacterium]|nr:MAG: TIGR00730 family Rossman fold protein [Desulfobacteraceae bacterium]